MSDEELIERLRVQAEWTTTPEMVAYTMFDAAKRLSELSPKWTRETPTEPGCWWMTRPGWGDPEIVKVKTRDGAPYAVRHGKPSSIFPADAMWCRIPEPEKP